MTRWSFQFAIYFLNSRYQQVLDIQKAITVQFRIGHIWRCLYLCTPIFMKWDSWVNVTLIITLIYLRQCRQVKVLDLLIYLKASIQLWSITFRQEEGLWRGSIDLDYLQKLNRRYESWIETYNTSKLLIVDVDKLNFIQNKEDLGS